MSQTHSVTSLPGRYDSGPAAQADALHLAGPIRQPAASSWLGTTAERLQSCDVVAWMKVEISSKASLRKMLLPKPFGDSRA